MKIDNLMPTAGANEYFSSAFRVVLEDHMTYLRTHPTTTAIVFNGQELEKYYGDLAGILSFKGIPSIHHWIVMRMNNMTAMTDLVSTITSVIVPNVQLIDKLRQAYMTQQKIRN